MQKKWHGYAAIFKELLDLEYSPVAISCLKDTPSQERQRRVRVCKAILEAGKGELIRVGKANNVCFGAAWHLGFRKEKSAWVEKLVRKFAVEGEKLFSSYQALDNLIKQMVQAPDNSNSFFMFAPLEKINLEPQLVVFVVNPESACRILALALFKDGYMPKINISGPTCWSSLIYPLVTGELNVSFYDYTSRKICGLPKDMLLISLPYKKIQGMVEAIDKCSAGRAEIELPKDLRGPLRS